MDSAKEGIGTLPLGMVTNGGVHRGGRPTSKCNAAPDNINMGKGVGVRAAAGSSAVFINSSGSQNLYSHAAYLSASDRILALISAMIDECWHPILSSALPRVTKCTPYSKHWGHLWRRPACASYHHVGPSWPSICSSRLVYAARFHTFGGSF